jgi:hypothetical protein
MIEIAPRSGLVLLEDAILYCQFLNYNGYADWRMPTWTEWIEYTQIHGWHNQSQSLYNRKGLSLVVYPVRNKNISIDQ